MNVITYLEANTTAFRFTDLPAELKLMCMKYLDPHSLRNLIHASPAAKSLYVSNTDRILKAALDRSFPLEWAQVVWATLILHSKRHWLNMRGLSGTRFLCRVLHQQMPLDFGSFELGHLYLLGRLSGEVDLISAAFAETALKRVALSIGSERCGPDLFIISCDEFNRMRRALWRLQLITALAQHCSLSFAVALYSFQPSSFPRFFHLWDLQEMSTLATFLETLRGQYNGNHSPHLSKRLAFSVQEIGYYSQQYQTSIWQRYCSPVPHCGSYHNQLAASPNFKRDKRMNIELLQTTWMPLGEKRLQEVGICVWDTSRLKYWGFMEENEDQEVKTNSVLEKLHLSSAGKVASQKQVEKVAQRYRKFWKDEFELGIAEKRKRRNRTFAAN